MAVSHGDLFSDIGKLVLAANGGAAMDLGAKSKELARRYQGLGLSEAILARVISRSIGAIELSQATISMGNRPTNGAAESNGIDEDAMEDRKLEPSDKSAAALFPSGVRLAVLS